MKGLFGLGGNLAALVGLGLVVAGSTGCTAFGYPTGSLYNGTVVPHGMMRLEGAGAPKPGGKSGQSCATGILGLVAFGDASLAAAKKAGGVTDVHSVEFSGMSILGIYSQGCTVVSGTDAAPPPPPPPAAPPPPPPPPAAEPPPPPPPPMKGAQLDIPGEIEFDVGAATIKDTPNSRAVLEAVLKAMSHPSITKIRVEGHTDSDGNPQSNLGLSEKRAASVIAWLVGKGIDPKRLHGVGCGARDPLVPNTSAENKQRNRRTEFDVEDVRGKKPEGFTEACQPNPAVHH
ncbi:MAG: TRL domain-containing protein [Polyangiaceae bacterium]|jgi:OOP family OmpA-OmpF porin